MVRPARDPAPTALLHLVWVPDLKPHSRRYTVRAGLRILATFHPHAAAGDTGRAMSQENVEIVRQLIEAWNHNEQDRVVSLESVVPFLDPGVIFDATRRIINPKTYAGIEGIRAMLAERDEVWGEFRMEPDEFVDAGDRVVAIGRWVSKGRGSGVEVNQPIADVFTLHGGRVVRCEIGYSDRAEALEAAGLRE